MDTVRNTRHDTLLLVGYIGKTHGVRGEVKVKPETDDPHRLLDLDTLFVGKTPESAKAHRVEALRLQPSKRGLTVVLKLEDIADRETADTLRSLHVYAREDDLPPLGEDEFFLDDLIGLEVVTEESEAVGKVKEILELPAQPVCVVARAGEADVLIPAVPEFIVDIDFDAGRLVVRPIEGLLE